MKRPKLCHECGSQMTVEKRWKSKRNPRTGNYHNITRWICACGMVDTIHGSASQDEIHTDAAIQEGFNEMNRGIAPPKQI